MSVRIIERGRMDGKSKFNEDANVVKKLTSAAARLKIHAKRKDKVHSEKALGKEKAAQAEAFAKEEKERAHRSGDDAKTKKGLPRHIVAATRVERRWTLTDLLQNLGIYVQSHCTRLHTIPSASEVAMWVRCADRALQLNGWTVNSYLLESHLVFTYMLLNNAFERFTLKTLADVKEIVLMCLYISYTYNANEISYPLRPFLVKQDKVAFWDKCTSLSLAASSNMLRLNKEHTYYADTLASLKRVTIGDTSL